MRPRTMLLLAVLALAAPSTARADDWPQWMGPKRDNVWRETGILEKFPKDGPKVLWRAPVAGGYAGPAVVGGKVYVTDRVLAKGAENPADPFDTKAKVNSTERVLCLDTKTGKELWKHEYDCPYQISYPSGPRCTPTVHEGKVYTLGAMGNLFCFEADTGKVLWEHNFLKEYKTKPALWGYASHPLIDGKKLVTLVGGAGSHVVAFDKDTGKEIWKAGNLPEQGYSPVMITEAGGKRQMIVAGPKAVYSVNPETGEQYWSKSYSEDFGYAVMTPVRVGDHLFVAGYPAKNLLVKLAADKPEAEVVFNNKKKTALYPGSVQPFLLDGLLYGYDDSGMMFAVELPSGKRVWEDVGPVGGDKPKGSETAFMVKNGDRFFFFAETGHLVIGKLTPQGYDEIDRAKVIEQTSAAFGRKVVWCAPAFADKKMFVRNDKEIICVDLAK
ncbi:Pyrrolo-quinoline quinone repeat-containing protein OS=Planctomyces brasiliensis (strain ATCC 49424 / DSM 5305 / JCM 21570 / NBRC 103401 / IFAM 1448) GN=Plabr_0119 PE=4 SV=1: PQQ_3: PQQ_2 [Gemmata massiliana]|uniref:Pyrrolo-quinoline quinone repeat domain-containing protein n=1 Tax=Gemmata massiliana TaxID=1210884 RepID=A0A6P2D8V8_9BACT|nr:PQQ-binding-like beta-propeller repeat protein [Gemmata massiliana]VTR95930.1 Pyrrolo-quinoline quinone repeat-containing protein OS=Planctomyces brasiliensis (strain ATCC 49424 / DSM 5305 / JCM 21570 / NBRC 103401 / IFAM 1448) GN=Plabr_0119 PE=4 SV=1: PQQ_3: PQQ_2 [Gemmata massiliana]